MDVHYLCARVLVCAIRMAEMMADVENTTPCARINNPVLESTTADTPPCHTIINENLQPFTAATAAVALHLSSP